MRFQIFRVWVPPYYVLTWPGKARLFVETLPKNDLIDSKIFSIFILIFQPYTPASSSILELLANNEYQSLNSQNNHERQFSTLWLTIMNARGELEVKLGFTVRAQPRDQEGSLTSLSRSNTFLDCLSSKYHHDISWNIVFDIITLTRTKVRGSFTSLSKAGSLLSIGVKERRKGSKVSDMARRVRGNLDRYA